MSKYNNNNARFIEFGIIACTILFLLVGKWTPTRIYDDIAVDEFFLYPRVVIAIVLSLLGVFYRHTVLAPYSLYENQHLQTPIAYSSMLICFLAYMILSAFWAPDDELAFEKAVEILLLLAVFASVAATIPYLRFIDPQSCFWVLMLAVVFALGVVSMTGAGYSATGRAATLGGGPNTFGANMALGLFGTLYFMLRAHRLYFVFIGLSLFFLFLILLSGSRGSMVAVGIGITAMAILKRRSWKHMVAIVICATIALAFLGNSEFWQKAVDILERRIFVLLIEQQHYSYRDVLFETSISVAQEHLFFGGGLNSFFVETGWVYPHNLFTEALTEGGIVGLSILVGSLAMLLHYIIRYRHQLDGAVIGATVTMFIFCQFSGDLFDTRRFFLVSLLVFPPLLKCGRGNT